jgi:thymidylate kinase/CYTH domain-containing protein
MSILPDQSNNDTGQVYRVALSGGPCSGKSTIQTILTDSFQNLGWKVYCVPETATILLGGGVQFSELTSEESFQFQLNLLRVMLALEDTYMNLAISHAKSGQKCLLICDRGAMDSSAYIDKTSWYRILDLLGLNELELRDGRYDCVVHLVTAAIGAEKFYTIANNTTRSEGLELARKLDHRVMNAWLGHPYFDVVDNSMGFEKKLQRVINTVYKRLGIHDKRGSESVKRKFLLQFFPCDQDIPGHFEDFDVFHDYLSTLNKTQARIRRRGQNGVYTYTYIVRMKEIEGRCIETRRNISVREYDTLMMQRDSSHYSISKKRRCFVHNHQYYQLDRYKSPYPSLILMEAYLDYRTIEGRDVLSILPPFIKVLKEITNDPQYSIFNLSKITNLVCC